MNDLVSGDLVLNDLLIKESALDKLHLPIKVQHGRLGIIKIILYIILYVIIIYMCYYII